MLDHGPHPPRSREKKEIRDVSTFTAQHVRAATRSRQKHNMLSLLHAACLKLLVFYFVYVTFGSIVHV